MRYLRPAADHRGNRQASTGIMSFRTQAEIIDKVRQTRFLPEQQAPISTGEPVLLPLIVSCLVGHNPHHCRKDDTALCQGMQDKQGLQQQEPCSSHSVYLSINCCLDFAGSSARQSVIVGSALVAVEGRGVQPEGTDSLPVVPCPSTAPE